MLLGLHTESQGSVLAVYKLHWSYSYFSQQAKLRPGHRGEERSVRSDGEQNDEK